MALTQDQVDAILDAYVEESSIMGICASTGLRPEEVRGVLEDPDLIDAAIARKLSHGRALAFGRYIDALSEVARARKAPAASRIRAFELLGIASARSAGRPKDPNGRNRPAEDQEEMQKAYEEMLVS